MVECKVGHRAATAVAFPGPIAFLALAGTARRNAATSGIRIECTAQSASATTIPSVVAAAIIVFKLSASE